MISSLNSIKIKDRIYVQVPNYGHQRRQYQLLAGLGLKHTSENGYIPCKVFKEYNFTLLIQSVFFYSSLKGARRTILRRYLI